MEKRYQHKSGRIVWTMMNDLAAAGTATISPCSSSPEILDITERKRAELRFHIPIRHLARILAGAPSVADAAPRRSFERSVSRSSVNSVRCGCQIPAAII